MTDVHHFLGPPAEKDPACWSDNISAQVHEALLGECLGAGLGRAVFVVEFNEHLVIKVETKDRSFQNVTEWQFWDAVAGTAAEKWLAPCYDISSGGDVLVQARTTPIPHDRKFKVPSWLPDLKRCNFGLYEGRIVCHDYGLISMARPPSGGKLVPVED